MQDLTTGSLSRHLLKTTSYMLVGMVFQTLYVLIDLYWVGRLGTAWRRADRTRPVVAVIRRRRSGGWSRTTSNVR